MSGRNHPARRTGRIPDSAIAWVMTWLGRFTLHHRADQVEEEEGTPYSLTLTWASGGYKTLNLTSLTEEELDAIVEFMGVVADEIRPVLRHRDEVARAAGNEGDTSFSRNYRSIPQLVVRSRPSRDDPTSVLQRLADAGGGSRSDSGGGSGGDGDAVVEPAPPETGPEEHPAPGDESVLLREVGGTGPDPH